MRTIETEIPGVRIIELDRREDRRGFFCQTFNADRFRDLGIEDDWFMDAVSHNAAAGTLRGLHFQAPPAAQAKIVRATRGALVDVVLDLRRASAAYGRCLCIELASDRPRQLYLPQGVAHGFCTIQPNTEVAYKLSERHAPNLEAGVNPFDRALEIDWPFDRDRITISDRDLSLPNLAEIDSPF